jgi:hypothetical protein
MTAAYTQYQGLTMADMECGPTPPPGPFSEVIQVSFNDPQCTQPAKVHAARIGECKHDFPEDQDYAVMRSCGTEVRAEKFFADDPMCNRTGAAVSLPVGACYRTEGGAYVVNSCEHTPMSLRLVLARSARPSRGAPHEP